MAVSRSRFLSSETLLGYSLSSIGGFDHFQSSLKSTPTIQPFSSPVMEDPAPYEIHIVFVFVCSHILPIEDSHMGHWVQMRSCNHEDGSYSCSISVFMTPDKCVHSSYQWYHLMPCVSYGRQRQYKGSGEIIVSGLKASYTTIEKSSVEQWKSHIGSLNKFAFEWTTIACLLDSKTNIEFFTDWWCHTQIGWVFLCSAQPFRYSSLVTSQRAKAVIALCWVLSFGIGLTPMFGWNRGRRCILPEMSMNAFNAFKTAITQACHEKTSPQPQHPLMRTSVEKRELLWSFCDSSRLMSDWTVAAVHFLLQSGTSMILSQHWSVAMPTWFRSGYKNSGKQMTMFGIWSVGVTSFVSTGPGGTALSD